MSTVCSLALLATIAGAVRPGEPMPIGIRQRVDHAVHVLRETMRQRDATAVAAAADGLRIALGDWAGVPERRPEFNIPPDAGPLLAQNERVRIWQEAWADALRQDIIPGADRLQVKHDLLRKTAYAVMGGLAAMRHGVGDPDEIRRELDKRLQYLLSVQRPDGLFPFPDLRGTKSPFAPVLESHYERFPEDFVDGWVIEDHGDGGLQFDNGVCAVTMAAAFEQLGDKRYLESARRACEWILTRPIVTNWNYNAFSVWAMARYTRLAGDPRFLAPAIERLRLGVLPGQLPNGRWMDPHNARTVYHAIILRALAELYAVISESDSVRSVLEDAIRRAERTLVDEIRSRGATDADHSLTALCAVDRVCAPDVRRTEAIRVVINAMHAHTREPRRNLLHDMTLLAVGQMLDWAAPSAADRTDRHADGTGTRRYNTLPVTGNAGPN